MNRSVIKNHQRNAQKRLLHHVRHELHQNTKEMPLNVAIRIFVTHYNIEVVGGLKDWLYSSYKTNEILRTKISYGKKRRLKTDAYLNRLCKSASKLKKYKDFLQSKYWKEVRTLVLKRDNHQCRICKSEINLQVHHDTYKHHFREHEYLDDLMTLCGSCHEDYHFNIKK